MSELDYAGGTSAAHLGEMASAYLDGELDEPSRSAAEVHLAGCDVCRASVQGERTVRGALRGLGPVEPPPGFLDFVLAVGPRPSSHARRRRRVRVGLAQLGATAAVWVLILAVGLPRSSEAVAPVVGDVVAAHTSAATSTESEDTSSAPPAPDTLPSEVGGSFELVDVRNLRGMVQAVYRRGDQVVSVFVQEGALNVQRLPSDAQPVSLGGLDGYRVPWTDGEVVILERGGYVYTLVAPSTPMVTDVPGDLPDEEPSPSIGDRLRDAADGLADTFALAG